MLHCVATAENIQSAAYSSFETPGSLSAERLTDEHREEVLAFLAERSIHTVCLAGLIHDNGLESDLNRGRFYACRNEQGLLEGVALIGHAVLIETRTMRALEAFAALAQDCAQAHMILGEQQRVEEFWTSYAEGGQEMRLACRELLYELQCPVPVHESAVGLRLATLDDLDLIVPVHAEMALAESGVNPLETDPEGFRQRCARRIERGRTWVLIESGRLIFKAEIQSDIPEVIYLEGIYVNPSERGKGYGLRCLSQLSRHLLARANSVCLLVNEQNTEAQALYRKAGYKLRGLYDTIFLQQKN
ncbi:MAG TPA: GNAT family N-acetyltransferase [Pyrinomonadaceae bacterium]